MEKICTLRLILRNVELFSSNKETNAKLNAVECLKSVRENNTEN
jgi:hypothetical protein